MSPREGAAPDFQDAFSAALFDPDAGPPPGVAAGADGRPAEKRFAVYRNNVIASLIEALGKAYPAVERLVGPEFFKAMAGVHVRAHPPQSPVMLFYGEAFPEWLEAFQPAASLPYLPDVARIERARRRAYHAADATPLTPADAEAVFGALAPEAVALSRIQLHPSLHLVSSAHPALSIWRMADAGGGGKAPAGPERTVIVRPDETVEMRAADAGAFAFLDALSAGARLVDAATAGTTAHSDFDLAAALRGGLTAGFFASIDTADSEPASRPGG